MVKFVKEMVYLNSHRAVGFGDLRVNKVSLQRINEVPEVETSGI